ncbi:MAG TPA: phosphotransferase [Polyangiaceae bacterium]
MAFILPDEAKDCLRTTFGEAPIENVAPMSGGLSASYLVSFDVAGHGYVLRKGDLLRAPNEAKCMQIASDRAVAPKLRAADPERALFVMDRITSAPPTRDAGWIARVTTALRRLHEGPAFPRGDKLIDLLGRVDGALRSRDREPVPRVVFEAVDEVSPLLAPWAESAPCHNDLNPTNIVDTGAEVRFVDWETACAGDPFVDLAGLALFAFVEEAPRAALLEAYLGRTPNEEERARAILSRAIALSFYSAAFTFVASFGPPEKAEARTIADLFALLGKGTRPSPATMAASFASELAASRKTDEFAAAKATLTTHR